MKHRGWVVVVILAMLSVAACSDSSGSSVTNPPTTTAATAGTTETATAAAPPTTVAVTGALPAPEEHVSGEEVGESGKLRGSTNRGPVADMSDPRVDGQLEMVHDTEVITEGERTTAVFTVTSVTISNEGGTWEGTGEGISTWTASDPRHQHSFDLALLGSGDYAGLEFAVHIEGIDFPWVITGTIGPAATAATTSESTDGPFTYVVMGDSILFDRSPSAMSTYKGMLEEDLGVEVEMRDHTVGGQTTEDFLDRLLNDKTLRSDLAEADVVVFRVSNHEWSEPSMTIMGVEGRDPAECGGDDGLECLRKVAAEFDAAVEAVFAEVTALADPTETIIRPMDCYQFTADDNDEAAMEILAPILKASQDRFAQVAGNYGIPVATVFDAFHGPDGMSIPEDNGLVGGDGIHPTDEGARLIAETIRGLGYETVISGGLPSPIEEVAGEESGEPFANGRSPHERGVIYRGPWSNMSDPRVEGSVEQVMDKHLVKEGDNWTMHLLIPRLTITNDNGTWEGTGEGTSTWVDDDPRHYHILDYDLFGTGAYEGLRFRFHSEGIHFPWPVHGTIVPVDG